MAGSSAQAPCRRDDLYRVPAFQSKDSGRGDEEGHTWSKLHLSLSNEIPRNLGAAKEDQTGHSALTLFTPTARAACTTTVGPSQPHREGG